MKQSKRTYTKGSNQLQLHNTNILNASWTTGWCPQAWRTATIVPFLKKDKDPQAVSSYRPIALTPTIGKLLERLIVNRLSWWLEAKSLHSRGKPGSASADVPPTNASDCPSSLAMAFSLQIRNEPFLCSSIILRHTTLSGEPVCSRRCLISESRCVSCSGRRLGLLTALLASNSTG